MFSVTRYTLLTLAAAVPAVLVSTNVFTAPPLFPAAIVDWGSLTILTWFAEVLICAILTALALEALGKKVLRCGRPCCHGEHRARRTVAHTLLVILAALWAFQLTLGIHSILVQTVAAEPSEMGDARKALLTISMRPALAAAWLLLTASIAYGVLVLADRPTRGPAAPRRG